ncbi:MAG: thioesterase family protein [Myxococcota bacterium]
MADALDAPFDRYRARVLPEWIDENGHLNMGYYVVVFDKATDEWLDYIGLTQAFKDAHDVTTFSVESHVTYQRELRGGDPLRFTTQLLGFDAKRMHYAHEMYHADEGFLASTNELMSFHVSNETRRSAPMAPEIQARLAEIQKAHEKLPIPSYVGRVIGLKAKRA